MVVVQFWFSPKGSSILPHSTAFDTRIWEQNRRQTKNTQIIYSIDYQLQEGIRRWYSTALRHTEHNTTQQIKQLRPTNDRNINDCRPTVNNNVMTVEHTIACAQWLHGVACNSIWSEPKIRRLDGQFANRKMQCKRWLLQNIRTDEKRRQTVFVRMCLCVSVAPHERWNVGKLPSDSKMSTTTTNSNQEIKKNKNR